MIKVVDLNKGINKKYKTFCECGAELEFEGKDIKKEKHRVFYGGDDFGDFSYFKNYIVCPNCGEILYEETTHFEEITTYWGESKEDKNV